LLLPAQGVEPVENRLGSLYPREDGLIPGLQKQCRLPGGDRGDKLFVEIKVVPQFDQGLDLRADHRPRLFLQADNFRIVWLQLSDLLQDIQGTAIETSFFPSKPKILFRQTTSQYVTLFTKVLMVTPFC